MDIDFKEVIMIKKIRFLLKHYDTLVKLIVKAEEPIVTLVEDKSKKKKVSIYGVPEEQKKYIEDNYKLN